MSLSLPDLLSLSDDDFLAEAEGRIAVLDTLPDAEAVWSHYQQQIFPMEQERLRRAAQRVERMDLLFVTCGDQADSITLAVEASPADYVVLLHTPESLKNAQICCKRQKLMPHQAVLTSVGDGKDQIAVYKAIHDLWQQRGKPVRVGVDITGGFKTMTAAAALAGSVLPEAQIFYVDSDQVPYRGKKVWLRQERRIMENPLLVFGDLERKIVRELLQADRWDAAAVKLQELHQLLDLAEDKLNLLVTEGYSLLERMNFGEASIKLAAAADYAEKQYRAAPQLRTVPAVASRKLLQEHARRLQNIQSALNELNLDKKANKKAKDPLTEYHLLRKDIAVDLLVTFYLLSERFWKAGQYDFSAMLSYRVEEGVLQRRLALAHQFDASVPLEGMQRLAEARQGSVATVVDSVRDSVKQVKFLKDFEFDPARPVGRLHAFVLLAYLEPELAARGGIERFHNRAEARNRSMLAHGLQPVSSATAREFLDQAKSLLSWLLSKEGATLEAALAPHRLISLLPSENVDD